jgi:hypothetical protein
MPTLLDKIKEYLSAYLPDDGIPSDNVIQMFIDDSKTENPYRIIYNMVIAATIKGGLEAAKFSDDGVSFQTGTGIAALEKFLPIFLKQTERWDSENGESYIQALNPTDHFGEILDMYVE